MSDSPTFRGPSVSSFASTATAASRSSHLSAASQMSAFASEDDLLADELFGAPDDGHRDGALEDDDAVMASFPSASAAAHSANRLAHSTSLSSFPDLSGDPSSLPKEQQRSIEDNRRLLALHCSTHLSLSIKHLLVAHRLSSAWHPTVLSLTQQAVSNVLPDMRRGDMMDVRYYVHIQPIPGGRKEDSCYVDGLAFQHTLLSPSSMVRYSIDNPRLLLFAGAIEPPFNKSPEARFGLSSLMESAQRDAEREWLDKRLPSVLFLRPDLIFVERHVSRYASEALRGAGVSVVTGVDMGTLDRIARCTRVAVLSGLDDVDGRYLGTCGQVRLEEFGIAIDEDDNQIEDDERRVQQPPKKPQETEIELTDLFSGVTVKQQQPAHTAPSTSLKLPSNSFDPFGGLLGNSPPPPSTALTSTSPGPVSILGSSFYNVGGSTLAVQPSSGGASSFKDLFSGLSIKDSTPPFASSPFSPTAASARRAEPTYVPFFFLRGCHLPSHCTIVLRGCRSLSALHKLQRVVHLAVHIGHNLRLEQTYLFESGVTFTAQSLQSMEQMALQNIEQARVAMQAVEESGGMLPYMTLLSSSPHITLPPIPFYPSLLNYRSSFPLREPANNTSDAAKAANSAQSQQPPSALQQPAAPWQQSATRDFLNFPSQTPSSHSGMPAPLPFDPSQLNFSSLPPPTCTALLQSHLQVGTCRFTASGQCRAPDVRTFDFYSLSDSTLAEYLANLLGDEQQRERCPDPRCKKDIFEHKEAFTLNDGRLVISVRKRQPEGGQGGGAEMGLPTPGPPSRSSSSPLTMGAPTDIIPRTMSPQPPGSGQSSPGPNAQYSPTSTHRGLPLPAPPVLQASKQPQLPRGAATSTHATTPTHSFSFNTQPNQPPQPVRPQPTHPSASLNSHSAYPSTSPAPTNNSNVNNSSAASPPPPPRGLITWSACKVCHHRVTPDTALSVASFSYSFGKFLDVTFNNHVAMSICPTCPHPVHTAHVRYFVSGTTMACFEYEKAKPFSVVARERVRYDRSEVMEGRLAHLSTLAMVSKQVFDEFLSKIAEIEANSRSAAFQDLLQQLQAKVKHEQDTFNAHFKRHGLRVAMLDSVAALNMSAERNNAALVQSLVEGGVDDEANALFGDEKSPSEGSGQPREQRPLLDTFDIHRMHKKLVLSFIEWNKMLTEMCSFIFPKGWEDSADGVPSGAGGAAAGGEERKDRSDSLQINIERSAHRLPPAPVPFNRDSANSPSVSPAAPYVRQVPSSPKLPLSGSREPLTPTLFASLHSNPSSAPAAVPPPVGQSALSAALTSSVSPNGPRGRGGEGGQSGPLLDTAQLRSMLSNVSDMFGGSGGKRPVRRSFKPNVTVEDLAEHNPRLKDVVDELIASPLGHGHFSLPHSVGGIAVPVYDDEPSSIIAYVLASLEHLQLVNPSKVEEMKQLEKDRAAAEAEKQQQQLTNGQAAHTSANGRPVAAHTRPVNAEINFFDDAVHVGNGDGGPLVIDNYVNPAPLTGTSDLFDLMSFGASQASPGAAVHSQPAAAPAPAALYRPSPFSFASPAPSASPLASAVQPSSQQQPGDAHRARLLGAVGPRSSISAQLYSHPHSQWFANDRPESAVEQCMLSGFADKEEFKFKFEDQPHHTQQPGEQPTQFRCVAYFPRHFHALRSHTCSGDYDFIQSMSRSDKWAASGGKSGSTFSKTSDDRYVLKYVKKLELDMFIEMAQQYFAHMAKVCFHQVPSVLVKTLGVYTLTWQRGKKEDTLHVVVMPNLFYQKTNVKVFDLKGSERNRYAAESTPTQLDANLLEYTSGLPSPVHGKDHALLQRCLKHDSHFLCGLKVIDYSLLVGFDHANGELLVGVIDYIRKYDTWKRMESHVKSMGRIAGQGVPTIVEPGQYKQRFRDAMHKYFMVAPDQCSWFSSVQDKDDDSSQASALREEAEEKDSSGRKGRSGGSIGNSSEKAAVDRPGSAPPNERPSGSKTGMFRWGRDGKG